MHKHTIQVNAEISSALRTGNNLQMKFEYDGHFASEQQPSHHLELPHQEPLQQVQMQQLQQQEQSQQSQQHQTTEALFTDQKDNVHFKSVTGSLALGRLKSASQKQSLKERSAARQQVVQLQPLLLNDLAHIESAFLGFSTPKQGNEYLKIKQIFQKLVDCLQLLASLQPNDTFNFLWDFFMTLFVSTIFFLQSLKIFFYLPDKNSFIMDQSPVIIATTILLVLDIFKNFFTSYYDRSILVTSLQKISRHYVSSYFVCDLIGILSFLASCSQQLYDVSDTFVNWFRLCFFVRLVSLAVVLRRLEQAFIMRDSFKQWLNLIKMLLIIIVMGHFSACLIFGVCKFEYFYENGTVTLLQAYDLFERNIIWQYAYSYYWASCLLVQNIQVYPQTPLECLVLTVQIIIMSMVIAYFINMMGYIMQDLKRTDENFLKDLDTLNSYINKKNIAPHLSLQMRNYLEYNHFEQKKMTSHAEEQIIASLPTQLRNELARLNNSKHLAGMRVLTKRFSPKFLDALLFVMHELYLSPQETVYTQGSVTDYSLYYVAKGEVELYHGTLTATDSQQMQGKETVVATVREGQTFGERSFFTVADRELSARSKGFCTLVRISRQDFVEILCNVRTNYADNSQHGVMQSNDYEVFCMLRDKLMFQSQRERAVFLNQLNQQPSKDHTQKHFLPITSVLSSDELWKQNSPLLDSTIDNSDLKMKNFFTHLRDHDNTLRTQMIRDFTLGCDNERNSGYQRHAHLRKNALMLIKELQSVYYTQLVDEMNNGDRGAIKISAQGSQDSVSSDEQEKFNSEKVQENQSKVIQLREEASQHTSQQSFIQPFILQKRNSQKYTQLRQIMMQKARQVSSSGRRVAANALKVYNQHKETIFSKRDKISATGSPYSSSKQRPTHCNELQPTQIKQEFEMLQDNYVNLFELDRAMNFTHYFPSNNVDKVIQTVNAKTNTRNRRLVSLFPTNVRANAIFQLQKSFSRSSLMLLPQNKKSILESCQKEK